MYFLDPAEEQHRCRSSSEVVNRSKMFPQQAADRAGLRSGGTKPSSESRHRLCNTRPKVRRREHSDSRGWVTITTCKTRLEIGLSCLSQTRRGPGIDSDCCEACLQRSIITLQRGSAEISEHSPDYARFRFIIK